MPKMASTYLTISFKSKNKARESSQRPQKPVHISLDVYEIHISLEIFETAIINGQQLCSCCLRNEKLSVFADKILFSEYPKLTIFEL